MKTLLIFDLETSGHHTDYLLSILKFAALHKTQKLVFVCDRRFESSKIHFCEVYLKSQFEDFTFDYVESFELDTIKQWNIRKRSVWEWELYLQKLKQHKADAGILMYFDLFQWGMFKGSKNEIPTAGIIFRAKAGSNYQFGWLNSLKNKISFNILKQAVERAGVRRLFLLDKYAVNSFKEVFTGLSVSHIADPVMHFESLNEKDKQAYRQNLGIHEGRIVFLIFGFLDERKGVRHSIEALMQLPKVVQSKICLLIAGPIAVEIKNYLAEVSANNSFHFQLLIIEKEFRHEAIQHLFDISDLVLALYQQHVGMSSVVIRAAISKVPILASDYGMMGKYVMEHGLGMVTDSTDTHAILKSYLTFLEGGIPVDGESQKEVATRNSALEFAKELLSFN